MSPKFLLSEQQMKELKEIKMILQSSTLATKWILILLFQIYNAISFGSLGLANSVLPSYAFHFAKYLEFSYLRGKFYNNDLMHV